MPGGDGAGPAGLGRMTGRAKGYCAGYPAPGRMNPSVGAWGFGGRGWGRGRGRGQITYCENRYSAYPFPYAQHITAQQETDMLKEEARAMKEEIKAIEERITELGTKTTGQKK